MRTKLLNFTMMSGEQAVRLLAGLLVMTMCARYLGVAQFGAYSYALSTAAMFVPLAKLGADGLALRESARSPDSRDRFVTTGFWLQLPACLACMALTVTIGFAGNPPEFISVTTLALASIIVFAASGDIFYAALKGMETLKAITACRLAVTVFVAIAIYLGISAGADLETFVAIRSMEAIALALCAMVVAMASTRALQIRPDRETMRTILRSAGPIALFGSATMIYTRADQYMLGQMSDAHTLGNYALAVRLTELFIFLAIAMQGALASAITRNIDDEQVEFASFTQKVFDIFSVVGWCCAGLVLATCFFVAAVFGLEYADAALMMTVLALTLPLVFQRIALGSILTIQGQHWSMALLAVSGAIVNILLNLWLIPVFGGIGAGIATVAALLVAGCGGALASSHCRRLSVSMCKSLEPVSAALRLWREYGHLLCARRQRPMR